MRAKLWKRSLKIYGYHLLMLALGLYGGGGDRRPHAQSRADRICSTSTWPILLWPSSARSCCSIARRCSTSCPCTSPSFSSRPLVLSAAVRFGWKWILAASGLVWLLAQFGLRDLVHNWIVRVTHLQIPLQETGAFNLFAWQAVWIVGLWLGARRPSARFL